MRTFVLTVILSLFSVCSNAQFKLYPGVLKTNDGPYTILRNGSEADNYEAAQSAVEAVVPDAEINPLEYRKSFSVSLLHTYYGKLFFTYAKYWDFTYVMRIDAFDDKIQISFDEIGTIMVWNVKDKILFERFSPTSGKHSLMTELAGDDRPLFNRKGKVAWHCKKIILKIEEFANGIVKKIENNLN